MAVSRDEVHLGGDLVILRALQHACEAKISVRYPSWGSEHPVLTPVPNSREARQSCGRGSGADDESYNIK